MNLVSPATAADLAEAVGASTSMRFAMLRGQMAAGESFALRRDGDGFCVACGGFVEVEPRVLAVWFAVNGAGGKAMPAVLRGMREAFALTLGGGRYSAIRIEVETEAGARMARLLGAVPDGSAANGTEVWHVYNHQSVQGQRRRKAGAAGSGGEPAARAGTNGQGRGGG